MEGLTFAELDFVVVGGLIAVARLRWLKEGIERSRGRRAEPDFG